VAALFSRRDRIAVLVIVGLIAAGWGIRLALHIGAGRNAGFEVIRNAVTVPDTIDGSFTADGVLVDINTAGEAALETLPMIGPSRARAIVSWRTEHGPFAETADIVKVPGIGEGIFEQIEGRITVSPGGSDQDGGE